MKTYVELPPTWLVGRKTRLRALEVEDVPFLGRCKIVIDKQARGFVVQTLDGRDIGALGVFVSGPHAAIAVGFVDDVRYVDGSATDALKVMCKGLPRSLPLERIEALVPVENHRSLAAHERAGFEREGVLREALLEDGRYRDAVVFSVLSEGIERWLESR